MQPVRFSHLKAYGRSALHGWHARNAPEDDPSYAMERGTAVHALIFGNRRVCGYPKQRRGKDFEEFEAQNHDATILTMAEYDKARRMADSILASQVAAPYLKGVTEETLVFNWNGLLCRATPDVRGADFLTELKTSATSEPDRFQAHALRMAYHAQMRMQQIAVDRWTDCFIICCEATPPHPVTVFRLSDKALEYGERLLMLWSERLKGCEAAKTFPSYVESVVPLDIIEADEDTFIFPEDEEQTA